MSSIIFGYFYSDHGSEGKGGIASLDVDTDKLVPLNNFLTNIFSEEDRYKLTVGSMSFKKIKTNFLSFKGKLECKDRLKHIINKGVGYYSEYFIPIEPEYKDDIFTYLPHIWIDLEGEMIFWLDSSWKHKGVGQGVRLRKAILKGASLVYGLEESPQPDKDIPSESLLIKQ